MISGHVTILWPSLPDSQIPILASLKGRIGYADVKREQPISYTLTLEPGQLSPLEANRLNAWLAPLGAIGCCRCSEEKTKPADTIELIQVGSPVTVGEDIPATITGIAIDAKSRVTYRCAWWNGRTREDEWLEQFEVTRTDETQDMTVGFQQ